jgi:uncharacterized protein YggU (UPF0235/DUF167 family)
MLIKVRVKTGARKESVHGEGSYIAITVKEKPEQNAANKRVIALLALELGVPIKSIRFVKGHKSPSKLFEVILPASHR